jgi:uncharacterized protein YecE (DUF72 family)
MGPGWSMGLMTILVGCSGWSYDDWVGRFYPIELAKKKGEWLAYYARYFRTVEINSTFYRPPGELQVASWIKKGIELKNIEYSLKMPQLVTHKSMVQGDNDRAVHWAKSFEKTCILPMSEAALLGCVLLQLSPRFQNTAGALGTLETVLDSLSFRDYNYAVEFRHRSWLEEGMEEIDPDAMQILNDRNVACVLVDGPGLHARKASSADHSYFRFHGRNYDIWYEKDKGDDFRLDRYDYLYSKEQLMPWVPRIKEAELKAQTVRVYFNNHARSKSVRNAFQLMDLLMLPHEQKEIRLQNQFTLESF